MLLSLSDERQWCSWQLMNLRIKRAIEVCTQTLSCCLSLAYKLCFHSFFLLCLSVSSCFMRGCTHSEGQKVWFVFQLCATPPSYIMQFQKNSTKDTPVDLRTKAPLSSPLSALLAPLSSRCIFRNWDVLQDGALSSISGSQAGGWRREETRRHKTWEEKWEEN